MIGPETALLLKRAEYLYDAKILRGANQRTLRDHIEYAERYNRLSQYQENEVRCMVEKHWTFLERNLGVPPELRRKDENETV